MTLRKTIEEVAKEIALGLSDAQAAGVRLGAAIDVEIVLSITVTDGVSNCVQKLRLSKVHPTRSKKAPLN